MSKLYSANFLCFIIFLRFCHFRIYSVIVITLWTILSYEERLSLKKSPRNCLFMLSELLHQFIQYPKPTLKYSFPINVSHRNNWKFIYLKFYFIGKMFYDVQKFLKLNYSARDVSMPRIPFI